MSAEPIVLVDDDDNEVHIPAEYEVCSRCRGTGTHDAWEGGMTETEMHEQGEEFMEDYFAGRYSVPCSVCGGLRVVRVPDERRCTPEQLAFYEEYQASVAELRAEQAAERRAGC